MNEIKSFTGKYFEVKVAGIRNTEEGPKRFTEQYAVEALTFTEAETVINAHVMPYVEEGDITAISIAPYKEIIITSDDTSDKYATAKVNYITIDERTAKEKKTAVYFLIQCDGIETARTNLKRILDGSLVDYELEAIKITKNLELIRPGYATV